MSKLTSLGLLEVGITDAGLERLAGLGRLRVLDLRGCAQVGNPGLKRLGPLKNLKVLRLGGSSIDDDSLGVLGQFGSLESLTIDEAAVTDAGLARLARLPLQELNLSRCYGVTDGGFQDIKRLAALRQLSLRGIPLSGTGLAQLGGMGKLAVLRLNETGVDDDALRRLAALNLKNLARLEFRQTLITDAAVEHLRKLTGLRNLDVRETGVTPSAAKRLAEALPKCKILN